MVGRWAGDETVSDGATDMSARQGGPAPRALLSPGPTRPHVLVNLPLILATAAAVAILVPVFTYLREHDLLRGEPWLLALLLALAAVTSTETVQRRIGSGRLNNRPLLRLLLAFGIFTAFSCVGGWSLLLPVAGVLVTVIHLQQSSSKVWRTAVVVVAVYALLAQVGVELGLVPTVVDPRISHLGAAWTLLISSLGMASVGLAVAERERSEHTLARTEARMRALMDSSSDVLTVSDADGRLTYVSPAMRRSMGYDPPQLLGSRLLDLVDSDHRPVVARRIEQVLESGTGARTSMDVLVILASHERRWYEWNIHNLLGDALVGGLVVDQRDVTERLLHQEALRHAAAHDQMTGLANRAELLRRLAQELPQATPGAGVAVLFIDLDRFKSVNDTLGHAAGDQLLVVVAQRLSGCLRAHDHLARLGGDEFSVVLTEVASMDQVHTVIRRLEAAVAEPVVLSNGVVEVTASIGGALATAGNADAAGLFAAADAAMYQLKNARRR